MQKTTTTAAACLAALFVLAACSRPDTAAPEPSQAPAASAPAPAVPTDAIASAAPAASVASALPAPRLDPAALTAEAWRVTASDAVAPGSLYVFLPDGTLLVGTPGSALAQGQWRTEGDRLVLVEASQSHPAEVLEQQGTRLRLRSHNPGTPVELTLAPVERAEVPERLRGTWARTRAECAQAGSESRLVLDGDTVRFHESSGKVLAAVHDPRAPGRVDLVMRLSGEGSERLAWRRLQLAADGSSLSDVTEGATGGLQRIRCP